MDLNISGQALPKYGDGKKSNPDMPNKPSGYFNVSVGFLINGEEFE